VVALAPVVANILILVDDKSVDAHGLQSCSSCQTALTAAYTCIS